MDEPVFNPLGSSQGTKKGKHQTVLKVSKKGGKCGGKGKKIIEKNKPGKTLKFSVLGANSAGLKAKKDSLINNIRMFD